MTKDQDISALMKDIVRYERMVGDLLNRNEALETEVKRQDSERDAWFDNRQATIGSDLHALTNIVLRLATQQSKEFDHLYRLLGQMILNPNPTEADSTILSEAFGRSVAFSDAVSRVVTGRAVEQTQDVKIQISDPGISARRGTIHREDSLDDRGRLSLILQEDWDKGTHGLVIPVSDVQATSFRAVVLEILPMEASAIRLKVRQADAPENFAEVQVDLRSLRYDNLHKSLFGGRTDLSARSQKGGWVRVMFEADMDLGGGPIEIEITTLNTVSSNTTEREGTGKNAFAIRQAKVARSAGLTSAASDVDALAELRDMMKTADAPQLTQVSIASPAQENARRAKRSAYLSSGAYRKLTKFKNKHAGKRAFIIGNGPSINGQDLTLLKDEVTFVTNWFIHHPQYTEINPSYFCVSSHEMFGGWNTQEPKANPDWLQGMLARAGNTHKFFSFPFRDHLIGDGVFPEDQCDFLLFDRPKYLVDERGDINLDLTQPMDDGYTGIITFCLPLAHYMGITEIYLIGCDCDYGLTSPDAPKSYFYDYSKHSTRTTSHEGLMRVWADNGPIFQSYEVVKERFLQEGIQIVNCTDGGRLEVFPRARYEDVIAQS